MRDDDVMRVLLASRQYAVGLCSPFQRLGSAARSTPVYRRAWQRLPETPFLPLLVQPGCSSGHAQLQQPYLENKESRHWDFAFEHGLCEATCWYSEELRLGRAVECLRLSTSVNSLTAFQPFLLSLFGGHHSEACTRRLHVIVKKNIIQSRGRDMIQVTISLESTCRISNGVLSRLVFWSCLISKGVEENAVARDFFSKSLVLG